MVPLPPDSKIEIVRSYVERSGYRVFIETGTYGGKTTAEIAKTGVKVFTIELSEKLHRYAAGQLAGLSNVSCLHGDSGKLLPQLLSDVNEPAVFWLDGHYSEGETGRGDRDTPLVEELYAILHHKVASHIILIDDVRLFDGITYPSVNWIEEFVRLYWATHRCDVADDIMRIRPALGL